jgi:hypothetical protein
MTRITRLAPPLHEDVHAKPAIGLAGYTVCRMNLFLYRCHSLFVSAIEFTGYAMSVFRAQDL